MLKKTQVGNKLSINNVGLELEPRANQGTILHAPLSPPVQGTSGPGRMGTSWGCRHDTQGLYPCDKSPGDKEMLCVHPELPTVLQTLYSSRHEVWGAPHWPLRAAETAVA